MVRIRYGSVYLIHDKLVCMSKKETNGGIISSVRSDQNQMQPQKALLLLQVSSGQLSSARLSVCLPEAVHHIHIWPSC